MKRIVLFLLTISVFYHRADAQSIYDIDMKLSSLLQKISYWEDYDYHDRSSVTKDSLDKANNNLYNYLFKVCEKNPATIKEDLPKAEINGLTIVTSIDHKLRMYSWDSRMGGSERYYENIAQYMTPEGVKVIDLKDSVGVDDGCDYKGITTIYTLGRKTIYLVRNYRIVSNKDRRESITAYTIDSGALKKVNIFKTKNKLSRTLACEFDAHISDKRFSFKEMPVIHLSENRQKLYIPIVKADEVTGHYLVYVFDGEHFIYDKMEK